MNLQSLLPSNKPELWRHPLRALGGTAFSKAHALIGSPWRGRRLVVGLVHGGSLEVELGEVVSNAILQHGVYEYPTAEFMVRYLHPGDTCLDVGGNIGFHAVLMGRVVGSAGRVLSFEPLPELRVRLEGNLARNRLGHVTARPEAVSDQQGTLTLYVPVDSDNQGLASLERSGGNNRELRVPTITLDEVVAPDMNVALMKVDVEGAEPRVFAGAARLLSRADAPSIMFEAHDAPPLVSQLEAFGFQVHAMGLRRGRPCLVPWRDGHHVWRAWDTPNLLAVKSDRGRAFVARHS